MEPQPIALPGFTVEQTASLQAFISAEVAAQLSTMNEAIMREFNAALDKQWPQQATHSTQHSTAPAPQETQSQQAISEEDTEITAEKQEQEPLYQATVEDDTEHGNSMLVNKSILSSFSCLCTTPASRDQAACPSKAPLSVYQQASLFGSFFGSLLTSFSASRFGFGCIECTEGMEASGQG